MLYELWSYEHLRIAGGCRRVGSSSREKGTRNANVRPHLSTGIAATLRVRGGSVGYTTEAGLPRLLHN